MIRLQIVERPGTNLRQSLLRAMRQGELKTFKSEKHGRKVMHVLHPGWLNWSVSEGVITCEIITPGKPGEEWKLLGAFIGRLADKYPDSVHSIQIQFPSTESPPAPQRASRPAARRVKRRPTRPAARRVKGRSRPATRRVKGRSRPAARRVKGPTARPKARSSRRAATGRTKPARARRSSRGTPRRG